MQPWTHANNAQVGFALCGWRDIFGFAPQSEYIEMISRYPGGWRMELERLLDVGDAAVSVAKASRKDSGASFHAVSLFAFEGGRIGGRMD